MPATPFIVASADDADALDIVGEHVTVLASGRVTGSDEVFLQRGREGSGPPPHSHPWDESFPVVRGEIEFGIDPELIATHIPEGLVTSGVIGPRSARFFGLPIR